MPEDFRDNAPCREAPLDGRPGVPHRVNGEQGQEGLRGLAPARRLRRELVAEAFETAFPALKIGLGDGDAADTERRVLWKLSDERGDPHLGEVESDGAIEAEPRILVHHAPSRKHEAVTPADLHRATVDLSRSRFLVLLAVQQCGMRKIFARGNHCAPHRWGHGHAGKPPLHPRTQREFWRTRLETCEVR